MSCFSLVLLSLCLNVDPFPRQAFGSDWRVRDIRNSALCDVTEVELIMGHVRSRSTSSSETLLHSPSSFLYFSLHRHVHHCFQFIRAFPPVLQQTPSLVFYLYSLYPGLRRVVLNSVYFFLLLHSTGTIEPDHNRKFFLTFQKSLRSCLNVDAKASKKFKQHVEWHRCLGIVEATESIRETGPFQEAIDNIQKAYCRQNNVHKEYLLTARGITAQKRYARTQDLVKWTIGLG